MTNAEFLEKIDSGHKFSEQEIKEIAQGEPEDSEEIEEIEGSQHRWQQEITTILEVDGRFFSLKWMRGLTESQESDYYNQPREVAKHIYEKTITVTEWKPIKDNV